jgi:hypothetical protein
MSLNICQKCGKPSLIKTPHGRVMLEEFFTEVHIANEYSFDCLKCGYSSGVIRENTELGNKLSKPWWKRIFSLHL